MTAQGMVNDRSEIFGPTRCAAGCGALWERICKVCLKPLCAAHRARDLHGCRPDEQRPAPPAEIEFVIRKSEIEALLSNARIQLRATLDWLPKYDGAVQAFETLGILTSVEAARWMEDARRCPGHAGLGAGVCAYCSRNGGPP